MPAAPYDTTSVVAKAAVIADGCRSRGAFVVLVHVGPSADGRDGLRPVVDQPAAWQDPPPGWDETVPELGPRAGDHAVRKRRWGAFYGTDLDLQHQDLLAPPLAGDHRDSPLSIIEVAQVPELPEGGVREACMVAEFALTTLDRLTGHKQ